MELYWTSVGAIEEVDCSSNELKCFSLQLHYSCRDSAHRLLCRMTGAALLKLPLWAGWLNQWQFSIGNCLPQFRALSELRLRWCAAIGLSTLNQETIM